jgi:hypothetical protein
MWYVFSAWTKIYKNFDNECEFVSFEYNMKKNAWQDGKM